MKKLNEINPKELDITSSNEFMFCKMYKNDIETMREEIRKEMIKKLKKCITEIEVTEFYNSEMKKEELK